MNTTKTNSKPARLGTIWPVSARIYSGDTLLAKTLDTPNSIAHAAKVLVNKGHKAKDLWLMVGILNGRGGTYKTLAEVVSADRLAQDNSPCAKHVTFL